MSDEGETIKVLLASQDAVAAALDGRVAEPAFPGESGTQWPLALRVAALRRDASEAKAVVGELVAERWRVIPGYPEYEVSDQGRVRRAVDAVSLSPSRTYQGYLRFNAYRSGRRAATLRVHAAVLAAFVGPRPAGMQTCHINGVRDDNRLVNLRYGSSRDNQNDKARHGNVVAGERHGRSKLTANDVKRIRASYRRTSFRRHNAREIAAAFGITTSMVHKIAARRYWSHVE